MTCLIIFEKTNISLNLSNLRFTNIEVARTITSIFKSSMKISLFQWSQISKHPNRKTVGRCMVF
jgi:hypothetical protein